MLVAMRCSAVTRYCIHIVSLRVIAFKAYYCTVTDRLLRIIIL